MAHGNHPPSMDRPGFRMAWRPGGFLMAMDVGPGWSRGGGRGWKPNRGATLPSIMDGGHLSARGGGGYQGPSPWSPSKTPRWSRLWEARVFPSGSALAISG